MVKEFKEIFTKKQRDKLKEKRARDILKRQGLLIIPKKSRKQSLRELGGSLRKVGDELIEEEAKLEKQLKKGDF